MIRFWNPLLCPILLLFVPLFYVCQISKLLIYVFFSHDESSTLVSQHKVHNRPCKLGKEHHKYDHCGKLGHIIERMPCMAVLVDLLWMPKLLLCNLLLWVLLHLMPQANLQFLMNFLNGLRITKTLVPLLSYNFFYQRFCLFTGPSSGRMIDIGCESRCLYHL